MAEEDIDTLAKLPTLTKEEERWLKDNLEEIKSLLISHKSTQDDHETRITALEP